MKRAGRIGFLAIAGFAIVVTFAQGLTEATLFGVALCAWIALYVVAVRSAVKR